MAGARSLLRTLLRLLLVYIEHIYLCISKRRRANGSDERLLATTAASRFCCGSGVVISVRMTVQNARAAKTGERDLFVTIMCEKRDR